MNSESLNRRVRNTPHCDWPVPERERSGVKNFLGLYGSEHIAATEFVIGAALVQYGCSATDIILGLFLDGALNKPTQKEKRKNEPMKMHC